MLSERLATQFSVSKREIDPAAVAPRISRRAKLGLIVQLHVLILVALICVRRIVHSKLFATEQTTRIRARDSTRIAINY